VPSFAIGDTDFLLDGEPHRVLSGAIHYFRVHPDDWADRIRSARLMGLNAIETYVAWNEHAARRGEFDLGGRLDLGRFLDAIAAEGMHAIVRPGPYICAEFDNGGLPAWLTRLPGMSLRRNTPEYMAAVAEYLTQLAPVLVPRQIDAGGPIILVQIENEYGAYGNDADYLRELVRITRELGISTPLTTIDQPVADLASTSGKRSIDVRRVLGRVVRQLGEPSPHHVGGRQRPRTGSAARGRGIRQHLHVPRGNQLRPHQRGESQGALRSDRHVLRLRRTSR
jgi:beta-galactosidase